MKTACFIPIKSNSERVKGKNFRILDGKPLYMYIIEHAKQSNSFDDIYIDTDSEEIKNFALSLDCKIIERKPELATNLANGNDLLNYHFQLYPDYDLYFQLFATAPFLQPKTIEECVTFMQETKEYDSIFTGLKHNGFFWLNGEPINYRPYVLPRSQDMAPVIEESTGLYGMTRDALNKYHCRIGAKPYLKIINKFESVDINTEDDMKLAEFISSSYWKQHE
jgi:N-acylneuraminate cytidylyltransferase